MISDEVLKEIPHHYPPETKTLTAAIIRGRLVETSSAVCRCLCHNRIWHNAFEGFYCNGCNCQFLTPVPMEAS